ncbi:MAG: hypothetical protein WBV06_14345 [Acidimicrobiia bacterium]|jgi:hypothetical protein
MRGTVLVVGTVLTGLGLAMILWRELSGARERRRVGAVRDVVEVLLPLVAAVVLVVWVWVS